MNFAAFTAWFAQASGGQLEVTLSNMLFIYGPMGAWIGWFMFRYERHSERQWKETRSLKHSIDGLSKAMLINALGESASPFSRTQAERLLEEMNTREQPN